MSAGKLSLFLVITCFMEMTKPNDCSASFLNKGSYCIRTISSPSSRTLIDQCEFCAQFNAHVMSLKEFLELRPLLPGDRYYAIRANYFQTTSRMEPIYDAQLGFVNANQMGLNFNTSGAGGQLFLFIQPSKMKATVVHPSKKTFGYCVQNKKEGSNQLHRFVIGFEGVPRGRGYHTMSSGKSFSKNMTTTSRTICLALCVKNVYCSTAYFSESKRICSHRIYMDTFIHKYDRNMADDFERYALYR